MKSFLNFLLPIVLLGCVSLHSQQKIGKSEKSFSRIKIEQGTKDITLMNDYGKKWKARITFPEKMDTENSLIIALHWAGDFGTYKEFNDCLALPGLKGLNSIIVSPEGERQLWSTENNVEKILSFVSCAKKYWNVDPKKIAVIGYSNGGNGSWYFAEYYPELFSAAIPMASAYAVNKKLDVPIYVIHGAKDELFDVGKTQKWVEASKKAGSNVTLVVNERLSHFQGCDYVGELKKAGDWLQEIWQQK